MQEVLGCGREAVTEQYCYWVMWPLMLSVVRSIVVVAVVVAYVAMVARFLLLG